MCYAGRLSKNKVAKGQRAGRSCRAGHLRDQTPASSWLNSWTSFIAWLRWLCEMGMPELHRGPVLRLTSQHELVALVMSQALRALTCIVIGLWWESKSMNVQNRLDSHTTWLTTLTFFPRKNYIYLQNILWYFDVRMFCKMIMIISLMTITAPRCVYLCCVWWEHVRSILCALCRYRIHYY